MVIQISRSDILWLLFVEIREDKSLQGETKVVGNFQIRQEHVWTVKCLWVVLLNAKQHTKRFFKIYSTLYLMIYTACHQTVVAYSGWKCKLQTLNFGFWQNILLHFYPFYANIFQSSLVSELLIFQFFPYLIFQDNLKLWTGKLFSTTN